jgi:hypothetical protein
MLDIEVKNLPIKSTGEDGTDRFLMWSAIDGVVYTNARTRINIHTHTPSDVGLGNVTNDTQLKASQLEQTLTNNANKVPSSAAVYNELVNLTIDAGVY